MKWLVRDLVKNGTAVTVGASATADVVSEMLYVHDPRHINVDVACSSIAKKTGLTIKLQDSCDQLTWNTKSSEGQVAVTSTAEVQTLTFPAKAGATAGDYFVVTDTAGNTWAAALNVSGADPAPTGAIWTAVNAARKVNVDISACTDAASVAAAVEAAFDALTGVTAVITTDDTAANGTMTFTAVTAGPNMAAPQFKNADDSGAGSITGTTSVTPVATGTFSFNLKIENSSDQADLPLRPFVRVVVATGAGDSVSVDNVKISHWGG